MKEHDLASGFFHLPPCCLAYLFRAGRIEQNTHRIGECVDERELEHAIAVLARFPAMFVSLSAS